MKVKVPATVGAKGATGLTGSTGAISTVPGATGPMAPGATGPTGLPGATGPSQFYINGIQLPAVLNDISTQFDGYKTIFKLAIDQTQISSLTTSKNLEVVIDGKKLAPYIPEIRFPWVTPYDSYKGYRVRANTLIVYRAPSVGSEGILTIINNSLDTQVRKYPYSATTIALGD